MSLLRRGLRSVQVVAATLGQRSAPVNIQVPNRFIKRIWVYVTGAFTITGGTGAGSINPEGSVRILDHLQLLVDGTPVKDGSGPQFFRQAQRYDQTTGDNVAIASKAAGANNTVEALVPLQFEGSSLVSPVDTLLDGRFVNNIILYITWANLSDLVPGNDGALAAVNLQAEVFIEDTDPFPTKSPFWTMLERETHLPGVGTSSGSRLILPFTPGAIMRGLDLMTTDGGIVSDAILKHFTLRINGQDKPIDTVAANFLRAMQNHQFGLAALFPVGHYGVEFEENGRLATTGLGAGLQLGRITSLDLILDTVVGAGATEIIAHTVEHVPPGVSIAG